MVRKILIICLALLLSFTAFAFLIDNENITLAASRTRLTQERLETSEFSCIQPTSLEQQTQCDRIVGRILKVTVRIEMYIQYYSQGKRIIGRKTSHATVMSGRYLVTHNHFEFPLTETADGSEEGYFAISLHRANGTLILDQAPLSSFKIVHADPQTLVLEFLNAQGEGLFAALGLPSADFTDWQTAQLQPDMELAQINWDGEQTRVDWVQIEALQLAETIPQLQVNNFVGLGCSGGGVFWNGQHIGNNLSREIVVSTSTGEVNSRSSIIALNSGLLAEMDK